MRGSNTADGYWSGHPRLNVSYIGGFVQTKMMASELAGTDPKVIEFIWSLTEKRQLTPAQVKVLCASKRR